MGRRDFMSKNKNTDKNVNQKWITVIGAREHNLKNITAKIPKDSLTVITGPSGSGKSSLALDILYTEGKRRYMESLSTYARQFLGIPKKPDVDEIQGLCPAIAIEQKTVGSNPRSTVGTITEIYDYLRVLFARIGHPQCYNCNSKIDPADANKIANMLVREFNSKEILISAPIADQKKGEFIQILEQLFANNYYRFKIDNQVVIFRNIEDIKLLGLKKTFKHTIEVLIDSIIVTPEETARIESAINTAFNLADQVCQVTYQDNNQDNIIKYSSRRMCLKCAVSCPELEPRLFSFNSPIGACNSCHGIGLTYNFGKEKYASNYTSNYPSNREWQDRANLELSLYERKCNSCDGKRLNKAALAVTVFEKNIYDICDLPIKDLSIFFENIKLSTEEESIASRLLEEIKNRINFLSNVGLGYLTLNRKAKTLSGGEGQRIRLATQIGSALTGVLYILDEPSIGLHQRDNDRLIKSLHYLRDQGNTVIVVEHDTDTMLSADYILDMGPGAGILGGTIIAQGSPAELMQQKNSLTGAYLSGEKYIAIPKTTRTPSKFLTLKNITRNNLQNLNVKFPLGVICGISGVSGSGKSTLIMQELVPAVNQALLDRQQHRRLMFKLSKSPDKNLNKNLDAEDLIGIESIENMIVIDQTPIGRTPRSNAATYLGIFDDIRKVFAALPESQARGYKIGRFSFNVGEGRCVTCSGDGTITVSMHFLPDVVLICSACKGSRYNSQTTEIKFKNKSIADILAMTAYEALKFFEAHVSLRKRLQLLCDVGLEYLKLGQSSTTLSGGEAQRIKLVDELAKRGNNTLYILDEPTTGLHTHDISKLLIVFERLVNKGNSLIVIEHNLDVLKTTDYIIDLGPEGGNEGGFIVAQGTPGEIAKSEKSYTGKYLKPLLKI